MEMAGIHRKKNLYLELSNSGYLRYWYREDIRVCSLFALFLHYHSDPPSIILTLHTLIWPSIYLSNTPSIILSLHPLFWPLIHYSDSSSINLTLQPLLRLSIHYSHPPFTIYPPSINMILNPPEIRENIRECFQVDWGGAGYSSRTSRTRRPATAPLTAAPLLAAAGHR